MTDEEYKKWAEVVDDLRGTAGFPIPDEYIEDRAFLEYLDQEIFICDTCGWWCERSEESMLEPMFGNCVGCAEEAGYEE